MYIILRNHDTINKMTYILLCHHALSYYILSNYVNEDVEMSLKWLEVSNVTLALYTLYPNKTTERARLLIYPWCRCVMFPMCAIKGIKNHGTKALIASVPILAGSFWWSMKIINNYRKKIK